MLFGHYTERRSGQTLIFINILTAVAYLISIRVSYQLINSELSDRMMPVWLSSALSLSLFFHFGYRILPGITLGAVLGSIGILYHFSPSLSLFSFLLLAIAFSSANIIQPIIANVWLNQLLRHSPQPQAELASPNSSDSSLTFPPGINPFDTVKNTLYFIRTAAITPLLSAGIGTIALGLIGNLPPAQITLTFVTWWSANALANLVFSPVFMLVRFETWSFLKNRKRELGFVFFLLVLVNVLTFANNYPVAYLYLPIIIITVCRLGGFIANVVVALVTLVALFLTAQGYGVFLQIFQIHPLIFLQSFTGILSLTSLLFSALTQERQQAQKALQQMIDSLENEVKCRTCELQISQQKLQFANQELEKLVNLDPLTQIANRRYFDTTLEQEWYRLLRERQSLSLLMLDVDYFKAYNDFYGHPQGDICLRQVAQVLAQVVERSTDRVARYGGEEFVILLPYTEQTGAIAIAQKIQRALADLRLAHTASPLQPTLTVSMGISCLVPAPPDHPSTLVQQADQALYTAKRQGRNQYQLFVAHCPEA